MDTTTLLQILSIPALAVALVVVGKVIVSVVTTWGVDDDKKPEILREVGEMFKVGRRRQ